MTTAPTDASPVRIHVANLDDPSELDAVRDTGAAVCGMFAVRKEYDAERGVWIQRLILDRRPRNASRQGTRQPLRNPDAKDQELCSPLRREYHPRNAQKPMRQIVTMSRIARVASPWPTTGTRASTAMT